MLHERSQITLRQYLLNIRFFLTTQLDSGCFKESCNRFLCNRMSMMIYLFIRSIGSYKLHMGSDRLFIVSRRISRNPSPRGCFGQNKILLGIS